MTSSLPQTYQSVSQGKMVHGSPRPRRPALRIDVPENYIFRRDDSPSSAEGAESASSAGSESPASAVGGPESPASPVAKTNSLQPAPTKPVVNLPEAAPDQAQPGNNAGGFITIVRPPPAPSNVQNPSNVAPSVPPPAATTSVKEDRPPPAASEIASSVLSTVEPAKGTEAASISESVPPGAPTSAAPVEKQSDTANVEAPSNTGLSRGTEIGIVLGTIAFFAVLLGAALLLYYRRKPKEEGKDALNRVVSVSKGDISKPQVHKKKRSIYERPNGSTNQPFNPRQPPVRTSYIPYPGRGPDRPLPAAPTRQSTVPSQNIDSYYLGQENLANYRTGTPVPTSTTGSSEGTWRGDWQRG